MDCSAVIPQTPGTRFPGIPLSPISAAEYKYRLHDRYLHYKKYV